MGKSTNVSEVDHSSEKSIKEEQQNKSGPVKGIANVKGEGEPFVNAQKFYGWLQGQGFNEKHRLYSHLTKAQQRHWSTWRLNQSKYMTLRVADLFLMRIDLSISQLPEDFFCDRNGTPKTYQEKA